LKRKYKHFVVTPVDKSKGDVVFCCKKKFIEKLHNFYFNSPSYQLLNSDECKFHNYNIYRWYDYCNNPGTVRRLSLKTNKHSWGTSSLWIKDKNWITTITKDSSNNNLVRLEFKQELSWLNIKCRPLSGYSKHHCRGILRICSRILNSLMLTYCNFRIFNYKQSHHCLHSFNQDVRNYFKYTYSDYNTLIPNHTFGLHPLLYSSTVDDIGNFFNNLNRYLTLKWLSELIFNVLRITNSIFVHIPVENSEYANRLNKLNRSNKYKNNIRNHTQNNKNKLSFSNSSNKKDHYTLHLKDLWVIAFLDLMSCCSQVLGKQLLQLDGSAQGSNLSPALCPFFASIVEFSYIYNNYSSELPPRITLAFQDDLCSLNFLASVGNDSRTPILSDFYPDCILERDDTNIFISLRVIATFDIDYIPTFHYIYCSPNLSYLVSNFNLPILKFFRYANPSGNVSIKTLKCTVYSSFIFLFDCTSKSIPFNFLQAILRLHILEMYMHQYSIRLITSIIKKLLFCNNCYIIDHCKLLFDILFIVDNSKLYIDNSDNYKNLTDFYSIILPIEFYDLLKSMYKIK